MDTLESAARWPHGPNSILYTKWLDVTEHYKAPWRGGVITAKTTLVMSRNSHHKSWVRPSTPTKQCDPTTKEWPFCRVPFHFLLNDGSGSVLMTSNWINVQVAEYFADTCILVILRTGVRQDYTFLSNKHNPPHRIFYSFHRRNFTHKESVDPRLQEQWHSSKIPKQRDRTQDQVATKQTS